MDFTSTLRRGIASVVCLATVSVPSSARADGLIQQLPEDGSWVRFEVETQYFDPKTGKPRSTSPGSQTVSSVGKIAIDDEPCRMIELKTVRRLPDQQTGEEMDFVNVYKFVIPENRLKSGEDPLEYVEEGWAKAPSNPAEPHVMTQLKLDLSREFRNFLWFELPGPLEDPRKLDAETIECQAGKYTCDGVAGGAKGRLSPGPHGGPEYQFQYETRTHKDVPFGVVRHRCEMKAWFPDGRLAQHGVVTYTLAETGKNAKSEIAEEKAK